jgi:hypothetical protein
MHTALEVSYVQGYRTLLIDNLTAAAPVRHMFVAVVQPRSAEQVLPLLSPAAAGWPFADICSTSLERSTVITDCCS